MERLINTTVENGWNPFIIMIHLNVNNSVCKISGLTPSQHAELKELLSYNQDPATSFFSKNHRNRRISLLDKRGEFPTGLLYIVDGWLTGTVHKTDYRIEPKRVISPFVMRLGVTPYPDQLDASNVICEAIRGICVMPTGTGKSTVIALIINRLQRRTLIVVPSLELKNQLTDTLSAAFGSDRVGGYGSDIAVENVDALDPKVKADYGCVIIDEFHRSGAKTYRKLNKKSWDGVYYKIGMTATPFRNQDNERLLLESVLSKVVYRLSYKDAVAKKYIVPLEAYYIDLPVKKNDCYTWAEVYSKLVVNNYDRNNIISNLIKTLFITKKPTLCLVKEIIHGRIIAKLSGFYDVPFISGENNDNKKIIFDFNNSTYKAVVGTTGCIGEGVDTKPAEYIVIAGLGKSRGAFMQQCGRGMRNSPGKESCKVIIFRDKSHKFTLRHFNAQVRYLKEEYGIKPVKLDVY